jgi:hypothetical protein
MPTRSFSTPLSIDPTKYFEDFTASWERSSRVNGKLKLTAHAYSKTHGRVTMARSNYAGNGCDAATSVDDLPFNDSHYNEVYAKFAGKLHAGGADLGVAFGSWAQTVDMIVDRCEKLRDFFSLKRASRRKSRRRPKREDKFSRKALASDVLEGEFGWLPLVADIYHGLVTVCGKNAIPSTWVHASSVFTRYTHDDNTLASVPRVITDRSGKGRLTIACAVEVENPNLWLLNRLGLINPLTVAWDLVPWSFVVNMFVNVNQILSSLTDFVGLTLSQSTVTRSYSGLREQTTTWKDFYGPGLNRFSAMNVLSKRKNRVAGPIPRPSLVIKAPSVDWNLCVIASALVVQKVKAFH